MEYRREIFRAEGSTLAYFCSRSQGDDHPGPMKVSLDFKVGNQTSKTSSSFDSVDKINRGRDTGVLTKQPVRWLATSEYFK